MKRVAHQRRDNVGGVACLGVRASRRSHPTSALRVAQEGAQPLG